MTLTRDQVQGLTGDAGRWADELNAALARWQIDTPARALMFLAQCAHESGGFRHLVENLHYSAAALLSTWPNRFTADEAVAFAYDEQRIAERAYGGRMGNGPEGAGDGYRYRGRGIIQLTGRDNYRRCGQALGIDLEAHPELLEQPRWAAQSAGWFWATNGCNALADAGNFEGVTRRINGGLNGYEDRKRWLAKVREILGADAADTGVHKPPLPAPGARVAADQPKEGFMGAIALPLLAQLLPQVLGLFSQRAQATIAEKTGDPKIAAAFMQNLIAQVGTATGITVTNEATATQAVAALTAAPDRANKVAALEPQALATLDDLLRAGDKASEWDARRWAAEIAGRKASSEIAIEEHKAGLWDMTRVVVYFAAITLTGLVFALLAALIYQATSGQRTIDSGLLGLAGPIFMAAVAAWGAIIAYRFDGTKQSSEQSKALTDVMRERAGR